MDILTLVLSITGCVTGLISLLVSHHGHSEQRHANLINLKLEYLNSLSKTKNIINSTRMNLQTASLGLVSIKNFEQRNALEKPIATIADAYEKISSIHEDACKKINNLEMKKANSKKTLIQFQESRVDLSSIEKMLVEYEKESSDILSEIKKILLDQQGG